MKANADQAYRDENLLVAIFQRNLRRHVAVGVSRFPPWEKIGTELDAKGVVHEE